MREGAVSTDLEPFALMFPVFRLSGTVFPGIQGAIAKQAVKVLKTLMAREIFTVPVFKKTV